MENSEFNTEVEKLYSRERKKEYYKVESVEAKRLALLSAFYDHYIAVSSFQEISTVDDFLATITESRNQNTTSRGLPSEQLITELGMLMQPEIEKYPVLHEGEMRVTGEGLYFCIPQSENVSEDESDESLGELELGDELIGDIKGYSVESMPSYEAFRSLQDHYPFDRPNYDDITPEAPSLLLHMENVLVVKAGGVKTELEGEVVVPINYPSIDIDKVIRISKTVRELKQEQEVQVEVITHFKSDFISATCDSMENTLNYTNLTPEQERETRERFQEELKAYMKVVDKDRKLSLSAFNAILASGDEQELDDVEVVYDIPVFIKNNDTWRIAHSFLSYDTDKPLVAHVFPEDIVDVHYIDEE